MSEQANVDANPGRAIYDALSDEAKAAVDTLPDTLIALQAGQDAARFLVESANLVDSRNSSLWSIQCDAPTVGTQSVVLNVGGQNIVALLRNHVRVLVTSEFADSVDLQEIRATLATDQSYKQLSNVQLEFNRGTMTGGDLVGVNSAHRDATQEIAELGYKVNHRWKWHRDDWRVNLAMLTGMDIPPPSYVPDSRLGLPMEPEQKP